MRLACVFVLLSMVPLLDGCAANDQSRVLASQLRKLTAEYNAASTRKIEAERQFYLDSAKNSENTLNVVDPTDRTQPNVKKTLAYGRIITGTNSAALKLAGELVDSTGSASTSSKITEFIQDGILLEVQAFHNAREQEVQSAQAMATDFDALEQYQTKLSELTKQLVELEKPTSSKVKVSQVEVIGKAVIEQIKKGQP
jgi:hypothetical protein